MNIYSIPALAEKFPQVRVMPYAHKVLLENLLRNLDGITVTDEQISTLVNFATTQETAEIQFTPLRVVMQDFTGVPCVVDLATMRNAITQLGGDPQKINPQKKVQLVIDHSMQIDYSGTNDSLELNLNKEFERNAERYEFLKWGQNALDNFECVPPGVGIIHQINLEKLADVVGTDGDAYCYDTCVGTDSHTTMINGIGVLGWGVGGIEAEAAMLGQPVSMLIPEVIGVKLVGEPSDNVFATDIILTITELLRKEGVVGKFVEFFGEGVSQLDVPVRATISNMCPEFGATCAIFGVDEKTLEFLELTGRSSEQIENVRKYHELQGTFGAIPENTTYSKVITLDLSTIEPSIAGPKRPQDRIALSNSAKQFADDLQTVSHNENAEFAPRKVAVNAVNNAKSTSNNEDLKNGDIVIASITSCTNTSNPEVLIAAGLVARNAVKRGLKVPEFVKTSFAPGSPAVTAYLQSSGLQNDLNALGFNTVGYGCATCIGNSGPNAPEISQAVAENNLAVTAVLSGNRNFEGRINPDVKMNYLATPPLVIAYALAGSMAIDLANDVIAYDTDNTPVYLQDLLPSHNEINEIMQKVVGRDTFVNSYAKVLEGPQQWQDISTTNSDIYDWNANSTYIQQAPYFKGMQVDTSPVTDITNASILLRLGDSVTTDHISPAGAIKTDSPAGTYLQNHNIKPDNFNSYGSRRGNHEVMMRGTFANIRLNNLLVTDFVSNEPKLGGYTAYFNEVGEPTLDTVFDASEKYQTLGTPLVVFAGKEYGTGSSRDWAAKGTALLGVKAVIAESFERIHRSNLIGMGVLPLRFADGDSFETLGISGDDEFSIIGVSELNAGLNNTDFAIPSTLKVVARDRKTGEIKREFNAKLRIDTYTELQYYLNGGILQYVLRGLLTDGSYSTDESAAGESTAGHICSDSNNDERGLSA